VAHQVLEEHNSLPTTQATNWPLTKQVLTNGDF